MKNLNDILEKLFGKNYLLWSQSFETFVLAHRKVKHLTHLPPDSKADTYKDCLVDDASIVLWLVNSMEPSVAREVMMLRPAKKI